MLPLCREGASKDNTSSSCWLPCFTCSRERCGEGAAAAAVGGGELGLPSRGAPLQGVPSVPAPLPSLRVPLPPTLLLLGPLLGEPGCSTASTSASAWLPSLTRCCGRYAGALQAGAAAAGVR